MWNLKSRLSIITFFLITSILIFVSGTSLPVQAEEHELLKRQVAQKRDVYIYIEYDPAKPSTGIKGGPNFAEHTYLWVAGNEQSKALRIEVLLDDLDKPTQAFVGLRELDYNPNIKSPRDGPTSDGKQRKGFLIGDTRFDNKLFLDVDGKKGFTLDIIKEDTIYRAGPGHTNGLNSCHQYVEKLVTKSLKLTIPGDVKTWWQRWNDWTTSDGTTPKTAPITESGYWTTTSNGDAKDLGKVLVKDICDKKGSKKLKRGASCIGDPNSKPITKPGFTEISIVSKSTQVTPESAQDKAPQLGDPKVSDAIGKSPDTKTSMVRLGAKLTSYTTVGKEVLKSLGVAGAIAGVLFVILDFVDKNWVGGAIGAAGLVAGTAAGLAFSGPVGWIVGGLITALMMILPAAINNPKGPANRDNVRGIIQWTFFGDQDHTGNEKCREGTDGAPGNPDCQVLYGSGTLSVALGLNNFDAIAFLTQFNDGYAMTIPEIAKAFYVADEKKNGDGDDKIAVIQCHNNKGIPSGHTGLMGGDSPKVCNKASYKINRQLIKLPHIDQTADKVFDRIIPAPKGDCKLVAYPGDQKYPDYGITLNGQPSAIACGLTESLNVGGTAVAMNPDHPKNPTLGSSGDQSTDGQGGAVVAPPPKARWKALDPKNYVCLYHDKDAFCVPPGKYDKQTGVGWEIGDMNGASFPEGGWALETHWSRMKSPGGFRISPTYEGVDNTFKQNIDPPGQSNQDFLAAMKGLGGLGGHFRITGPTDGADPVCCLFTKPDFGGNALCLGVGGDEFSDRWRNKAQSVSCHGGANMWMYADHYGDLGAQLVRGDVTDLSSEPYGKDSGTFSQNVKAVWVLKP